MTFVELTTLVGFVCAHPGLIPLFVIVLGTVKSLIDLANTLFQILLTLLKLCLWVIKLAGKALVWLFRGEQK